MIDAGKLFETSMGCKVAYDICSICGHKSKTASSYCKDMTDRPGEILDDGRKVFVYNPDPNFFDISRVLVGADKTSRSYGKIASVDSYPSWFYMPSGLVAIKCGDVKDASINKEIPASAEFLSPPSKAVDAFSKTKNNTTGPDMDKSDLKKLAGYDADVVLSSFAALGIKLNPSEFQHVMLTKMGKGDLADSLYKLGYSFTEIDIKNKTPLHEYLHIGLNAINPDLLKLASKYLAEKSILHPYLTKRVLFNKKANFLSKPLVVRIAELDGVAGLYSVYLDKLAEFGPAGLRRAEQFIPEVKFLLSDGVIDSLSLSRTAIEKLAEIESEETIRDLVVGSLLSPRYKFSLDAVNNTDPSHWKLASALPELTPTRISVLHPDTAAWVSIIAINTVGKI